MANYDQFINDTCWVKYQEIRKLTDVDSKDDPENQPYKSLYEARNILTELKASVEGFQCDLKNVSENSSSTLAVAKIDILLSAIYLELGVNFTDSEETHSGEEYLNKSLKLIEGNELKFETTGLALHIYNTLGILWAARSDPDKALKYLLHSDELYKQFTHEIGSVPKCTEEIFGVDIGNDEEQDRKRTERYEDSYTKCLFYLAQIYGKIDEGAKSAKYCQMTLIRQLETYKYEPMDWALNAATLSQYYVIQNSFTNARHCLAAASFIMTEAKDCDLGPVTNDDGQDIVDQKEKLPRANSDLERCWVKYCLGLLEASRDKLYDDEESTVNHNSDKDCRSTTENCSTNEGQDDCEINSVSFNLELTHHEDQITDKYVRNFDKAKELFLLGLKWCTHAKEFYVLDGHCSDNIEIVQDISKLYKHLAFFEPDLERQCKMHKRRIDNLLSVRNEISLQYYLLVGRQLIYEVAETFSSMVDLKLAIIEMNGTPATPHAIRKINLLVKESISQYEEYLDTLKIGQEKKYPEEFQAMDVRPAFVAVFCLGRLYSKLFAPELREKISNYQKSLEFYKMLVDYCNRNASAIEVLNAEYDICKEMVELIPLRIERARLTNEF